MTNKEKTLFFYNIIYDIQILKNVFLFDLNKSYC